MRCSTGYQVQKGGKKIWLIEELEELHPMSRAREALSPEHETTTARGAKSVPMPGNLGRSNTSGLLGRHI